MSFPSDIIFTLFHHKMKRGRLKTQDGAFSSLRLHSEFNPYLNLTKNLILGFKSSVCCHFE